VKEKVISLDKILSLATTGLKKCSKQLLVMFTLHGLRTWQNLLYAVDCCKATEALNEVLSLVSVYFTPHKVKCTTVWK